jgi:hypothetical protein
MKTSILAAVTVAALATSGLAHADGSPGADTADLKDPGDARMFSLLGTAASVGVMVVGANTTDGGALFMVGAASAVITPSLGEWYAGDILTTGLMIRGGAAIGAVVGMGQFLSCLDTPNCHGEVGLSVAGVSAVAFVSGAIYDIVDAPAAARRYNNDHHLRLAPTATSTASGKAYGVGLSGSF